MFPFSRASRHVIIFVSDAMNFGSLAYLWLITIPVESSMSIHASAVREPSFSHPSMESSLSLVLRVIESMRLIVSSRCCSGLRAPIYFDLPVLHAVAQISRTNSSPHFVLQSIFIFIVIFVFVCKVTKKIVVAYFSFS